MGDFKITSLLLGCTQTRMHYIISINVNSNMILLE